MLQVDPITPVSNPIESYNWPTDVASRTKERRNERKEEEERDGEKRPGNLWIHRNLLSEAKFAATLLQYSDNFLIPLLLTCFAVNSSDEWGSRSDTGVTAEGVTTFFSDRQQIKAALTLQSIKFNRGAGKDGGPSHGLFLQEACQ